MQQSEKKNWNERWCGKKIKFVSIISLTVRHQILQVFWLKKTRKTKNYFKRKKPDTFKGRRIKKILVCEDFTTVFSDWSCQKNVDGKRVTFRRMRLMRDKWRVKISVLFLLNKTVLSDKFYITIIPSSSSPPSHNVHWSFDCWSP